MNNVRGFVLLRVVASILITGLLLIAATGCGSGSAGDGNTNVQADNGSTVIIGQGGGNVSSADNGSTVNNNIGVSDDTSQTENCNICCSGCDSNGTDGIEDASCKEKCNADLGCSAVAEAVSACAVGAEDSDDSTDLPAIDDDTGEPTGGQTTNNMGGLDQQTPTSPST